MVLLWSWLLFSPCSGRSLPVAQQSLLLPSTHSHTSSTPSSTHRRSHSALKRMCWESVSVANRSEYQESLLAAGQKVTSSASRSHSRWVESERSSSENAE